MERKWREKRKENDADKEKSTKNVKRILHIMILTVLFVGSTAAAAPESGKLFPDENIETASDVETDTENGMDNVGDQIFLPTDMLGMDIEERRGEIRVHLTDGKVGTSKENIWFYCVKVADIQNGKYVLTEMFRDSGVKFEEIHNSNSLAYAAERLSEYEIEENDIKKEAVTDLDGNAVFQELEAGVYLICAEDNESFETIVPTLVAIPTWEKETGEMLYEIELLPKHTEKPEKELKTVPQTGDRDYMVVYLSEAAACFAGALIVILLAKNKT